MSDIDLMTTEQIVDHLRDRCVAIVVAALPKGGDSRYTWRGEEVTCLGLAEALKAAIVSGRTFEEENPPDNPGGE